MPHLKTALFHSEGKAPETLNEVLSKELALLGGIRSAATPTLLTFDAPIAVDKTQLQRLGLEPDGWQLVSSADDWEYQQSMRIEAFLGNFHQVLAKDFLLYIQDNENSLRLGGSALTTLRALLELRPEIERGICFVPVGQADGISNEVAKLIKYVNQKRQELITELETRLNKRLLIQQTSCLGVTPICVSFYQPGSRSMVMIKDEQEIVVPDHTIAQLRGPTLLLIDTRELIQPSYMDAMRQFIIRPDTLTVIGLGATSILPEAMDKIKTLWHQNQGEMAFSGNKGEVEVLLDCWDGVSKPQELIQKANLRFLLETEGQKGATLYLRLKDVAFSAKYQLKSDEIFYGDTTNAGDMFLAGVLAGLMELRYQGEAVESFLLEVLKETSVETLKFLQAREQRRE